MKYTDKVKKTASGIGVFLFWIAVWWIIAEIVNEEIILPTPYATCRALFGLIITGQYWLDVIWSILRVLLGFLAGCLAGLVFSYLSYRSTIVSKLISPLMTVIRSTPVASIIIIALVWIGKNNVPVFISFLMVTPVIYDALVHSYSSVEKELNEVALVFGANREQRYRYLIFPKAIPDFVSASVTAMGFAWKSNVAAEVLSGAKNSIGTSIYESKIYLETPDLFAWTLTVIVLSFLFERMYRSCAEKLISKI